MDPKTTFVTEASLIHSFEKGYVGLRSWSTKPDNIQLTLHSDGAATSVIISKETLREITVACCEFLAEISRNR